MGKIILDDGFKQYLLSSYQINEKDLARLLDDLAGAFNYTLDSFVQQRHLALQKEGHKNREIYQIIQDEVKSFRFVAPELSQRQIRRIIYG